jgi:hypothetical protein
MAQAPAQWQTQLAPSKLAFPAFDQLLTGGAWDGSGVRVNSTLAGQVNSAGQLGRTVDNSTRISVYGWKEAQFGTVVSGNVADGFGVQWDDAGLTAAAKAAGLDPSKYTSSGGWVTEGVGDNAITSYQAGKLDEASLQDALNRSTFRKAALAPGAIFEVDSQLGTAGSSTLDRTDAFYASDGHNGLVAVAARQYRQTPGSVDAAWGVAKAVLAGLAAWAAGALSAAAAGGTEGAGVVSGGTGLLASPGSGLTLAAGTGTGAGLSASVGSGLTLAAETGTGAGLAIGTGASIIGAGLGTSLAAFPTSFVADDLATASASVPAASSSSSAATSAATTSAASSAADSVVAPAASASPGLSASLPSLADVAKTIGLVGSGAQLVDQLAGKKTPTPVAAPGRAAPGAPGSIAAGLAGLNPWLIVAAVAGVAYVAAHR